MWTDLSAIDLFLLSGYLDPDARIDLAEGVILEATTNTLGQYILVVIGHLNSGVANVETKPGGRVRALFVPGSGAQAPEGKPKPEASSARR